MFGLFEEGDEDLNDDGILLELLNVRHSLQRESLSSNVRDPTLDQSSEDRVVLDDPFLVDENELFDDEGSVVTEVSSGFETWIEQLCYVCRDVITNRLSVFAGDNGPEGSDESFIAESSEEEVGRIGRMKAKEFGERCGKAARLELLEQPFDVDNHLDYVLQVHSGGGMRKEVEDVDDSGHNFEFSIVRGLFGGCSENVAWYCETTEVIDQLLTNLDLEVIRQEFEETSETLSTQIDQLAVGSRREE